MWYPLNIFIDLRITDSNTGVSNVTVEESGSETDDGADNGDDKSD